MRTRSITVAVLLVTAAVLSAKQAFRAGAELVRLPVVVTGRDGAPVTGLRAEDFEVREDGRLQRIQLVAEGASGSTLPLHLGLMLDTSESMQNDLSDAMKASIQFVNTVEESVDTTLVDFDSTVRLGRFVPASYPQLFERIRARKASGMTALYDAMGVYLADAFVREGQHVLVVYSDGGDSSSGMVFGKLVNLLRIGGNVVIYTIGYLQNQLSSAKMMQQVRLAQIAEETGGRAFFPSSTREMDKVYEQIVQELASRYTLGYAPDTTPAGGAFRKLQVKVVRSDMKSARARTRTGYYVR